MGWSVEKPARFPSKTVFLEKVLSFYVYDDIDY